MDAIYFDFSKAFDRINHFILSTKLARLSFPLYLSKLILNFTINQKYTLKINNASTPHFFTPLSGVPQRSHLGPLLYLIYCNDLPTALQGVQCLLYADDTKIYRVIESAEDNEAVQRAIDALQRWAQQNRLTINDTKTVSLSFHKTSPKFPFTYSINHNIIHSSTYHRDLGVVFDEKLRFHYHTDQIAKRAMSMTGAIYRLVTDINCPYLAKRLYYKYILPVVEYCSVIWNLNFVTFNAKNDKTHRHMTRIALRSPYSPLHPRYIAYESRLQSLGIDPLEWRRRQSSVICLLKILRGELFAPSCLDRITSCLASSSSQRTRDPNIFHNIRSKCVAKSPLCLSMNNANALIPSRQLHSITYYQIKNTKEH